MNERNLTAPKLAQALGLTKQSVYNFMTGHTKITFDNLEKIAAYFKVPMIYFFQEEEADIKDRPFSLNDDLQSYFKKQKDQDFITKDAYGFLKDQLKQKDEQIKFLQHLINEKL